MSEKLEWEARHRNEKLEVGGNSESKNLNIKKNRKKVAIVSNEEQKERMRIRLNVRPLHAIWGQYGISTHDCRKQKTIFQANLNLS